MDHQERIFWHDDPVAGHGDQAGGAGCHPLDDDCLPAGIAGQHVVNGDPGQRFAAVAVYADCQRPAVGKRQRVLHPGRRDLMAEIAH
jgi:hypothetical protein